MSIPVLNLSLSIMPILVWALFLNADLLVLGTNIHDNFGFTLFYYSASPSTLSLYNLVFSSPSHLVLNSITLVNLFSLFYSTNFSFSSLHTSYGMCLYWYQRKAQKRQYWYGHNCMPVPVMECAHTGTEPANTGTCKIECQYQ